MQLLALAFLLSSVVASPVTFPTTSLVKARTTINDILALIASLFPVDIAIQDATSLITAADQLLADDLGFSTTQNGLEDGDCGDLTIVFARGTSEPGNVGALVGPEFFNAVQSALPSGKTLVLQGVDDYSASVEGFLEGGDPTGSSRMAALIQLAYSQCPDSKVVMSGYSQGGQLVHNAASELSAADVEMLSSIVIFGDPDDGETISNSQSSQVLVICHDGDDICQHGDLILLPHLTYAENASTAASFVISNAGF